MYYKDNEPEEYFTVKDKKTNKYKADGSSSSSYSEESNDMACMCRKMSQTLMLGLAFIFLGYIVPEGFTAAAVARIISVNPEIVFIFSAMLFMILSYFLIL
jgi:hypothetical protein